MGRRPRDQPPRKKDLSARSEAWFWHVLALALGGRTVAEWQGVMTPDEFGDWIEFYRMQPFDDFHRFHRPAALIATSMGGGEIQPRLDWLQPPASNQYSSADLNTLKAFGFKPKG